MAVFWALATLTQWGISYFEFCVHVLSESVVVVAESEYYDLFCSLEAVVGVVFVVVWVGRHPFVPGGSFCQGFGF